MQPVTILITVESTDVLPPYKYGLSIYLSNDEMTKSNSLAWVVRVEVNLPDTSTVIARYLVQMHNNKMFDLKNEGQSDRE